MNFAELMNLKSSPWLFPFLTGQNYSKIFIFIGILLLFCDAPFIDKSQPYLIIRSGRRKWCTGQIIYVFGATLFYFAFMLILSILLNINHLEYNSDWGKVIGTIGNGLALDFASRNVSINWTVINYFTPITAMFYSYLLLSLGGIFIGMILFFTNILTENKVFGFIIASFFVFLEFIGKLFPKILWISPISWVDLNNIDLDGISGKPNITYILVMFSILISALIIGSIIAVKRKEIEVNAEI
jgi:hypothetical protein